MTLFGRNNVTFLERTPKKMCPFFAQKWSHFIFEKSLPPPSGFLVPSKMCLIFMGKYDPAGNFDALQVQHAEEASQAVQILQLGGECEEEGEVRPKVHGQDWRGLVERRIFMFVWNFISDWDARIFGFLVFFLVILIFPDFHGFCVR